VVPRQEGEAVRKILSDLGLLDLDLHIKREPELLLIPIRDRPAPGELDGKYVVKEDDFEQRTARFKNYKEAVEGVPKELLPLLPTAFDVVGDVALIKLPEELYPYGKKIGEAMLKATPSVRIVAQDKGVQGIERIRELEILAGQGGFVTVHREQGMRFAVDISRCYFSPRLSTERTRVATLVRDGERVLDMFAGVGPFSVLIAKTRKVEKVIAIDINPTAIEYLKKNILLNKVENVEPVCADAKEYIKTVDPVDRVLMNLPHTSFEYLGDAILACAEDATIHFYEMTDEAEARSKDIEALAILLGRTAKVVGTREVRTYSPTESQWAFDIKVYIGQGSGVQPK